MSELASVSMSADRLSASVQALARLGASVWQAGSLARHEVATAPSGWPALDAELPGAGWPLAGLSELLLAQDASGELALLAPWLRTLAQRPLGARELLWVEPPGQPSVAALEAAGLPTAQLVCVHPVSAADAAWACEQALRAGSCAAVLWWARAPTPTATLRRLHLAAQSGATPLMALRPAAARAVSSPAPLRAACTPLAGRRLGVEVFKRRGPPMAAPLVLALPWPAAARPITSLVSDVVDRPAPAPAAAASPALVSHGS